MGNDDARTFQLGQVLYDNVLTDVVECRCSLVEEKHFRLSDQRPCNQYALPLTARYALAINRDERVHA